MVVLRVDISISMELHIYIYICMYVHRKFVMYGQIREILLRLWRRQLQGWDVGESGLRIWGFRGLG